MATERIVFQEILPDGRWVQLRLYGEIDHDLLEGLCEFVGRQKKRLYADEVLPTADDVRGILKD